MLAAAVWRGSCVAIPPGDVLGRLVAKSLIFLRDYLFIEHLRLEFARGDNHNFMLVNYSVNC